MIIVRVFIKIILFFNVITLDMGWIDVSRSIRWEFLKIFCWNCNGYFCYFFFYMFLWQCSFIFVFTWNCGAFVEHPRIWIVGSSPGKASSSSLVIIFVVIVIIIIIILASLLSTIDSFKSITVILKLVGIPLMMMICYQMTITASQVDCFSWIWMVLNFLWMMFTWSLQSSPFGQ